jgi:hypothetical protein
MVGRAELLARFVFTRPDLLFCYVSLG